MKVNSINWSKGTGMDAAERMRRVRMIEQINANQDFSRRLGIRNVSAWEPGSKRTQLDMG